MAEGGRERETMEGEEERSVAGSATVAGRTTRHRNSK